MPGLGAPPGGPADCTSASEELHLPDAVVKNIANYAVLNEAPGHALLNLLVMCGVCRQWRSVARDVNPGVCLGYDGLDNTFSQQTSVQRFRRLSHDKKEQLFVSAAGLFTGYTEASFAGDGVSDRLLLLVAERAGCRLTKIRIQSSSGVTDHGLSALIAKAPKLQHLALEDLSNKSITGNFMVRLFQGCPKMLTLHLANIPHLNWTPCKSACAPWREQPTTKLVARGVGLDADFGAILCKMPHVTDLDLDGPARNVKAASLCCPKLQRVSYQVSCRPQLDEALAALMNTKGIKQLELIIKNFILTSDQLRVIGMLPVVDLRLDSFIYKQQPTLSRSSYSHVDNEGVKALVDSICNRWCALGADMKPLKLSLCGATSLTHDAVSALLRLPILTELDINGCCRITAMDKMRLVAKVRAGREMLESGRRPSMRSSRFPGLML